MGRKKLNYENKLHRIQLMFKGSEIIENGGEENLKEKIYKSKKKIFKTKL